MNKLLKEGNVATLPNFQSRFKTGLSPKGRHTHGAFHFRFFKAPTTVLSPLKTPSNTYNAQLRDKQTLTRANLNQQSPGTYQTQTPRKRRFKEIEQSLPVVSAYSPQADALAVLREMPESPYKVPKRRKLKVRKMVKRKRAVARYPDTPETPFKAIVIKIDCRQKKGRGPKVKGNNKVMGNLPATNAYTTETFSLAIESNKENARLAFEHNHLTANHFKRYACESVFGKVDPKHPDNPANMAEALKQINSQMMKAELVVDALYAKIHDAYHDSNLQPSTMPYAEIASDNTAFADAFNEAMVNGEIETMMVGVNVSLLRDSNGKVTHCADEIEYHIGWNQQTISFKFDAKVMEAPTWNDIQVQRDFLERFFQQHFDPSQAASARQSLRAR